MPLHAMDGGCDYRTSDRCDEHGHGVVLDRCGECDPCAACEAEGAADGARDDQKDDDVQRDG